MTIGFSTGSLAQGDFRKALTFLKDVNTDVIEISALRETELPILIEAFPSLDLKKYKYISVHAPSKLVNMTERHFVNLLLGFTKMHYPIIVHPDIITDFEIWEELGSFLCIENMDKRKSLGRTTSDLNMIFSYLPQASFCLDVAHAKQVDPTMIECYQMLKIFGSKLRQIHVSDLDSESKHVPLNLEAIISYRKIVELIPNGIPVILESPASLKNIKKEIQVAASIFRVSAHKRHVWFDFKGSNEIQNPFVISNRHGF